MKELSEVVSDLDKGGASAERVTVLTLSCLVPYPPSAGWSLRRLIFLLYG